jgi:hypothetical protein
MTTLRPVGGSSGSVATDALWDAKGDLAVGTGANTSAKLTVGTDGQLLIADSTTATGQKWAALRGYIDGLALTVAADTDHDITVGTGMATNSTNACTMNLATAMTKRIDAAWAAGDAGGGLFSGSVGNTTWYHVFLIRKDSDNSIDAGFDTSLTAANKPAGYTYYRRLGSVLTNGSANIIKFYQIGDHFIWDVPVLDLNGGTATTATAVTLSTPLGVSCLARIQQLCGGTTNVHFGGVWYPNQTDLDMGTVQGRTWQIIATKDTSYGLALGTMLTVWTNTSSQIEYNQGNPTGQSTSIITCGWMDSRGKDA